jgi:hypothetical protein
MAANILWENLYLVLVLAFTAFDRRIESSAQWEFLLKM